MAAMRKTSARRPARRKRAAAPRARRRPAPAAAPAAVRLQQRHSTSSGLALLAIAVLLGFVLYVHWDGGSVGDSLATAFPGCRRGPTRRAGRARRYRGVVLDAPCAADDAPFRAGALLLFGAAALALAGNGPAHGFWSPSYFRGHGGILGQGELWLAARLLGTTGAHILAVFLVLAGVVLLSGGSLAAWIRHGGLLVARATRRRRDAATAARAAERVDPAGARGARAGRARHPRRGAAVEGPSSTRSRSPTATSSPTTSRSSTT